MKYSSWTLGLVMCFAWRATAWKHVDETRLQAALDSSGYTLIAFVLPAQNASKALEREWLALQETEKDDNIVSFDCATSKVCKDLQVKSFPAIRMYHRDGRMDRYRGTRRAKDISMFLRRALRPSVLELDAHLVPDLPEIDNIVFIGYIHPDDWNLYDRFYDLARDLRGVYGFVISPPDEGATRSVLVCYNNVDGERRETLETAGVDSLDRFVRVCAEPLVPDLTRRRWEEASLVGKRIIHYFAADEDEKDKYRQTVRPLAKKHSEIQFVITGADHGVGRHSGLGRLLSAETRPRIVLEDTRTGEMYSYSRNGKVTAEEMERFLTGVEEKIIGLWNDEQVRQERVHEEL